MAQILYLTNIQIDFGVLATLGAECEKANIKRPLIVTDQGVKAVGILQKALNALQGLDVAVFDQTPSNPTEAAVRAAVERVLERIHPIAYYKNSIMLLKMWIWGYSG